MWMLTRIMLTDAVNSARGCHAMSCQGAKGAMLGMCISQALQCAPLHVICVHKKVECDYVL